MEEPLRRLCKLYFDSYDNADQVREDYLLVEVNDRSRPDLEVVKDVIQYFFS